MKKLLLCFIALATFAISYAQEPPIDVPETWETDVWDFPNSGWNFFARTTNTFNADCYPTESLLETIDLSTGTLENAGLLLITYNSNNLATEQIFQFWDIVTSQFVNSLKTDFFYNGNDLTETITYEWMANSWQEGERAVYTYNSGIPNDAIKYNWDTNTSTWLNSEKFEFTYNSSDKLVETIFLIWDNNTSSWINDRLEMFSYSSDILISKEIDEWNGSGWENHTFTTYTSDSSNFIIEKLKTEWDGSTYINEKRTLRTNNSDGNPTEMIDQNWMANSWTNGTRDRRTYPDCNLAVTEQENLDFTVSPNPSSENITISSTLHIEANVTISDNNGRIVHTGSIEGNNRTIDISQLSEGIYFITIESKQTRVIKKIVKN